MTTGPENPYGEPDPGMPPTHQPYGAPPPPSPYGQQPYPSQQPYGQQPYAPQQYPPQQPGYGQAYPQPYGQPYPYPVAPPTDGLALGAMITGIAALVLSCAYGLGLLAAPVALVLGRVSMKRI